MVGRWWCLLIAVRFAGYLQPSYCSVLATHTTALLLCCWRVAKRSTAPSPLQKERGWCCLLCCVSVLCKHTLNKGVACAVCPSAQAKRIWNATHFLFCLGLFMDRCRQGGEAWIKLCVLWRELQYKQTDRGSHTVDPALAQEQRTVDNTIRGCARCAVCVSALIVYV